MLGKLSDPSDSFFRNIVFIGHFQDFPVPETKKICGSIRHPHDIEICVHGITGNIVPDQVDDPFSQKVPVMDLFQS